MHICWELQVVSEYLVPDGKFSWAAKLASADGGAAFDEATPPKSTPRSNAAATAIVGNERKRPCISD